MDAGMPMTQRHPFLVVVSLKCMRQKSLIVVSISVSPKHDAGQAPQGRIDSRNEQLPHSAHMRSNIPSTKSLKPDTHKKAIILPDSNSGTGICRTVTASFSHCLV